MANDLASTPKSLRVCFVFASKGIGGAERSMMRLMKYAHPHLLNCHVILANNNHEFSLILDENDIPHNTIRSNSLTRLVSRIKQIDPDIVYLFGTGRTFLWALAAKRAGIKGIIGAERSSMKRKLVQLIRQIDKHIIHGYICNARCAVMAFERIGISPDRLFLIYNGISQKSAESQINGNLSQLGQPSILCVANIQKQKGQSILLQAIHKLKQTYPEIRAVLLGKDYTNGLFFEQMEAQALTETFIYLGFVPNVNAYLSLANIFVLPSLHFEGTPTSILEAMITGVPIIASDVGGVSEIIDDGKTGLLCEPENVDALAQKMELLLESESLRKRIISQAHTYVQTVHTMEHMVSAHVNAFNRILESGRQNL